MAGKSIASGALVLTADNTGLSAGLQQAKSSIKGFATSLGGGISFFGGGPIGAGVAAIKGAFATVEGYLDGLKDKGKEAESALNFSESIGVSAEQWQRWSQGAKIAGMESEDLQKMMKGMVGTLGGLSSGSKEAT